MTAQLALHQLRTNCANRSAQLTRCAYRKKQLRNSAQFAYFPTAHPPRKGILYPHSPGSA